MTRLSTEGSERGQVLPLILPARLGRLALVLANAFYLDRAYAWLVRRPGRWLADSLSGPVDTTVIDGTVNGIGRLFLGFGRQVRRLQTGFVRNYALGITFGVAAILLYVVARVL